jgi:hypothetical protein
MSFSIYVGVFEAGEIHRFPVAELRERFGEYLGEKGKYNFAPLMFEPGVRAGEVHFDDGEMIDGFSVLRPPDYQEFWEIIAGILRDFPCLLYWGHGAVMGSLDLLPHLPKDFVERLGIPWVSIDPERIRQYVWDNS